MSATIVAFPLLALLGCAVALWQPHWFIDLKSSIVPLLGVIMLGMGTTLGIEDFRRILRQPARIGLGMVLQYGVMPAAAWLVGTLLGLPTALLVGLVLVGTSAGGTASNVICYLARGDVALSITLTLCSTLLATFAMPWLTLLYVGEQVPVPVADMLFSIVKLIVLPVVLGISIRHLFARVMQPLQAFLPWVSMLAIVFIITIIVALNHERLPQTGLLLGSAVILHNLAGLLVGYCIPRFLLGMDRVTARTLAIEVGMQNSGLSVALALKYFSATTALPGALFSIWHNLSGALLAAIWSRQRDR